MRLLLCAALGAMLFAGASRGQTDEPPAGSEWQASPQGSRNERAPQAAPQEEESDDTADDDDRAPVTGGPAPGMPSQPPPGVPAAPPPSGGAPARPPPAAQPPPPQPRAGEQRAPPQPAETGQRPAPRPPASEQQAPARAPPSPPPPAAKTVISGATVSGATISDAVISEATISDATIKGAAVTGAKISGSKISGDTISGGTVAGGTVAGGTVSGGTVAGGTISGGTIEGGTISGGTVAGNGSAPPQPRPSGPAAPQASSGPDARGQSGKRNDAPQGRRGPVTRDPGHPGQRAAGVGDEEDEEDVAARALQHLLVQRGALLLPIWGIEVVPGLTYGHTSADTVATLAAQDGTPTTLALRKRSHQLTGALTFRIGLPLDLQFEASAPLAGVWSDVTIAGSTQNDSSGFGLGDPRFTLTWQVLHGGSLLPDLFVAAAWKPPIGSSPFDAKPGEVGVGTGYHSVGGTITAVKTLDPLVFLANASYTANVSIETKAGRRNPGDSWGVGGGAILAVSPETSMSFLFDFHYKPDDTLAGKELLASDETSAILQIGLGTVVSRHVLLNFMVGMGLTSDSPGFQFGVSMPVRF